MTSGARLDTNAQWLSRRLAELGVIGDRFIRPSVTRLEHNVDDLSGGDRNVRGHWW